jgi:hypothetical protein
MELQDVNLQLIGNIVTITSFTSLALICGILKRDNDRLTAQLQHWRNQNKTRAGIPARTASKVPETPQEPVDIRQFVARRSQNWVSARS